MNDLRNDIVDAVIELVFCSFPGISEGEFRGFVGKVLGIVDYTVGEVLKDERERRLRKAYQRTRN